MSEHDLSSPDAASLTGVSPAAVSPAAVSRDEPVAPDRAAQGDVDQGRSRPVTGDRTVDDALAAFDRAVAEGSGAHVEAAAEAHRALQARLTAQPPPPAAPGEARPGPRR